MHPQHRFKVADYCVFVGMLLASAVIGIYYAIVGRKNNTTSEFLMGGRSLGVIPVALSLLASFLSAITLLGTPAEIYNYGTSYWTHVFVYPLIMYLTANCFIPVFYNLEVTSSFEYLELRFNKYVRTLGAALFTIQMTVYMAIVLYAPSLALSQVTGIHVWHSVLSIGIVCTFYTSIGGLKAVIWTDVFQTLMMFGSMLIVVIKGIVDVGGLGVVWQRNLDSQRIDFVNWSPNPIIRHSIWAVLIGTFFNWGCIYCTNQTMVQRYLSTPTLKKAKQTTWVVLPLNILLIFILCFAGLVLFAKYWDCDPISSKRVSASDQLFPLFVMETLGSIPGLPGLFVSGIFSGALSTVSSGLNSLAAVTLEDFIKVYTNFKLDERKATLVTKLIAVAFGLLTIVLVVVAQQMGNVLSAALAIFGLLGSPVFSMFITGMFFSFTNSKGTFIGTVTGLAISLWIGLGSMIAKPYNPMKPFSVENCTSFNYTTNVLNQEILNDRIVKLMDRTETIFPVYRISYMYFGVIAGVITILVSVIASLIIERDTIVDEKLLTPFVRYYIEKRRKLQFWKGQFEPNQTISAKTAPSQSELSSSAIQLVFSGRNNSRGSIEGIANVVLDPTTVDKQNERQL